MVACASRCCQARWPGGASMPTTARAATVTGGRSMPRCLRPCSIVGARRNVRMAPDSLARADWQPDEADRLLLQAVLLPGLPGQTAWQAWSSRAKLDDVGSAAYRLLTELYQTLMARGVEPP